MKVRLETINNSGVLLYPEYVMEDGILYKDYMLSELDIRRIVNGYENRIANYKDRIIKLETELAQFRDEFKMQAIPTGNKYGGGYGD